jgi:anti-sigma factor RsiW
MNEEQQLKLQAFVDGELPDNEAREVSTWLARDAEAIALSRELRNTRQALKNSDVNVRVPESREFYWSKIQRAIERLQPVPGRVETGSWFQTIRRILLPAGSIALLALVGIIIGGQTGLWRTAGGPDSEMAVADSGAFTYHDYANGTTLVWVSYPAER